MSQLHQTRNVCTRSMHTECTLTSLSRLEICQPLALFLTGGIKLTHEASASLEHNEENKQRYFHTGEPARLPIGEMHQTGRNTVNVSESTLLLSC